MGKMVSTKELWRVPWRRHGYPYYGLYIIGQGDDEKPVKIGISLDLPKRLSQMQASHWRKFIVRDYFLCADRLDAERLEAEVHQVMREGGLGVSGEWFDATAEKARAAVLFVADLHGLELHEYVTEKFAAALTKESLAEKRRAEKVRKLWRQVDLSTHRIRFVRG